MQPEDLRIEQREDLVDRGQDERGEDEAFVAEEVGVEQAHGVSVGEYAVGSTQEKKRW